MSGREVQSNLASGKKKPSTTGGSWLLKWLLELVQTLFVVLLTTYLLLILLETVFEGSVSYHMNLNHLLIVVIVVGVAAVLAGPKTVGRGKEEGLTARTVLMIICAGVGGATIVWYKTKEIGWLSFVISLVSGGLIVLLSMLIWRGDEEDRQELDRTGPVETEERTEKAGEAGDISKGVNQAAKEATSTAIREAEGEVNEEGNSRSS